MDRHATLTRAAVVAAIAAIAFGGAAWAKAPAKKKPERARGTHSLHLRSIDLARRVALVEVGGVSKPPAPNLYRFTDERDRHYVAMSAQCEPPSPSGVRACELVIPAGYERHRLKSLELHLGGLHSRMIAATPVVVAAAWAAAEASREAPTLPVTATVRAVHAAAPDGGADRAGRRPDEAVGGRGNEIGVDGGH
jgi:hypothetical protein